MESFKRVTDVYLFTLLSAFILISAPYTSIAEAKFTAFVVLSAVYIAVMLYLCIKNRCFHFDKALILCLGAYFAFTLVSALLSPYDYNIYIGTSRYNGLITQLIYCITILLIAAFGKLREAHIHTLGATMTLFCVLSIIQFLGFNPLGLYPEGMTYLDGNVKYSGEYFGTLGNADFSSVLLAMAASVFLASLLTLKEGRKYWLLLPLILCILCLAWAKVAEGIVGFAVSYGIIVPLYLWQRSKRIAKIVIAAEIIILLVLLAVVYFADFGESGTLFELHEVLHGNFSDTFGSRRIGIWRQVVSEMAKHPLFGTGPDSMMNWELEPFSRDVGSKTIYRHIDAAHNEYLDIAAQQGLLALIAVLGVIVLSWKRYSSNRLIPFAAVLSYEVSALFGISMCIVTPIFLAFLALTLKQNESSAP